MSNKDCFHNIHGLPQLTSPGTVLLADAVEATHYPNGFIPPGTILARYTSGGNVGYLSPYVHNHAGGTGLNTAAAMVWDGFYLKRGPTGAYQAPTGLGGSILLAGLPVQIIVSKLPGLLNAAAAAYAPVAADLPSGFIAVDLGI